MGCFKRCWSFRHQAITVPSLFAVYRWWPLEENVRLTMGLFDLGNVISRTGFRSHVLHNLTIPFSSPPAITLMDTPSGWFEKATEQMISLQWTCPTRSPFTVQSLRSLPPPAESHTVAMSPVVSLAETAVTGLLCPARLCT